MADIGTIVAEDTIDLKALIRTILLLGGCADTSAENYLGIRSDIRELYLDLDPQMLYILQKGLKTLIMPFNEITGGE